MKKIICALIAALFVFSTGGGVFDNADALSLDAASSDAKINYCAADGLRVRIVSNSFDPRAPLSDVDQKVVLTLSDAPAADYSALDIQFYLSGTNAIKIAVAFIGENGNEGFVRISFSQFVNPSWETVGGEFTDKNGLVYFVIGVNTLEFSGHTFILDSVGVYRDETEIRTMFKNPQYTVDKAIESGM